MMGFSRPGIRIRGKKIGSLFLALAHASSLFFFTTDIKFSNFIDQIQIFARVYFKKFFQEYLTVLLLLLSVKQGYLQAL